MTWPTSQPSPVSEINDGQDTKSVWLFCRFRKPAWQTYFACFGFAADSEAEAFFGEDVVSEFECDCDAGEAGWPGECTEADGGVELAEDFDADDPTTVGKATVDFIQEPSGRSFVFCRAEIGRCDVGELNAVFAIEPFQQLDFTQAKWALVVVKDFNRVAGG